MKYVRPNPEQKVPVDKKQEVLKEYLNYYYEVAEKSPAQLNQKLPRKVFEMVLSEIGCLMLKKVEEIVSGQSAADNEVLRFLEENPLPESMHSVLNDELRVFALMMNSLKQWVGAESAATDRWVFSGEARTLLKKAGSLCPLTKEQLSGVRVELHHPVRDGRPPIPMSSEGHRIVELVGIKDTKSPIAKVLIALRKEGKKRGSWKALWQGCCLHMGEKFDFESPNRAALCRSLANYYKKASNLSFPQIRQWIEDQELLDEG